MKLSYVEISEFCRELALLLHAGISTAEGLYLLAEEDKAKKDMLERMAAAVDEGAFLSKACEGEGCFPAYVCGFIMVGENAGRLEDTLNALARYYDERDRMTRQLRNTLVYPAVLLLLMLVVIVVLLGKVLPVFNDIYASLGGQLTGVAGGLLLVGQGLNKAMPVLCAVMAAVLAFAAVFSLHGGLREKLLRWWNTRWGDRGIARKLNNARFAEAIAMGFASGLPLEEAVDMAAMLLEDNPQAAARCKKCAQDLQQGNELAKALGENGFMPLAQCRLLTLGMRSGKGDAVMEDIAVKMSAEADEDLERTIGKIEPTLVLLTSVLVGVILLSVMLPLMNIMTAIG